MTTAIKSLFGKIKLGYCLRWIYSHSSYGQTSFQTHKTDRQYVQPDFNQDMFSVIERLVIEQKIEMFGSSEPYSGPPSYFDIIINGLKIDCGFFQLEIDIPENSRRIQIIETSIPNET